MIKRKIGWLILSCLMVSSLVLASCAPAVIEEEEEAVTEEEEAVTEEKEEVVIEEKEEVAMVVDALGRKVEKPKYGGVFTFALSTPILGFDPHYTSSYATYTLNLTNEEPVTGDWAKGPAGTGEVTFLLIASVAAARHVMTPSLAESWELTEPDSLVLHFRKGVHFHNKPPVNGREMTAEDYVATITRGFEIPRSTLNTSYPEGSRPVPPSGSTTAPDKWTAIVKGPPEMIGNIYNSFTDYLRILPRELIEEGKDMKDWKASCGTGPFMLVDYVPASSATFARNPNYWRQHPMYPEDTMPYLDGVEWLIIPDLSTRLAALRTGKIDCLFEVPWEEAEHLLKTHPHLQYTKELKLGNCVYMRVDKPELPFSDIRVRQALHMAVDNQAIARDYFGGNAEVFAYPIAPVVEFGPTALDIYTPLDKQSEIVQEMYGYHPDKAKQLLAEAGYPDGFTTEVICRSTHVEELSIVQGYWSQVGVDLKLDVKEYGVYSSALVRRAQKEAIVSTAQQTSPYRFRPFWWPSRFNYSCVNDPRLQDTYFVDIAENLVRNDAKVDQILKDIYPYILEQALLVELPSPYVYTIWQPWVKDYHGEDSVGYINYYSFPPYIWLDQDLKEEMTGRR